MKQLKSAVIHVYSFSGAFLGSLQIIPKDKNKENGWDMHGEGYEFVGKIVMEF